MVIFQPSGRRGYVSQGKTIKEASRDLGVDLEGICGEKATCGKCRVRIEEGVFNKYGIESKMANLTPITEAERKFISLQQERNGYRLACQAGIQGDILVFVPEESRMGKQVVRKALTDRVIDLKPAVKKYFVELPPATLEEPLGDWERLQSALSKQHGVGNLGIDYQVLFALQGVVRGGDWKVTVSVWMDKEVIKVEPGFVEKGYGLAVDIGTTTVAGYLCDLTNGEIVATASMMNPQVVYGEDVMSRISYSMSNKDGLEQMNQAIIDGINGLISEAALQAGIRGQDILDMTIVGNTCMHHIFLNLDPQYVGKAPFPPGIHHSLDIKVRDIGFKVPPEVKMGFDEETAIKEAKRCLDCGIYAQTEGTEGLETRGFGLRISPGAYVHVLPIEAGFVGADNVAVLIAEEPEKQDSMELVIDIGTNGELVLGNRKKLVSSSCATGPAFEGAQIRYGMRAAPGAIEKIEIDPDTREVRYQVIGRVGWNVDLEAVEAKGICGSGIIDAIAQMFKAGIIQPSGRFNTDLETPRLRKPESGWEFVIAWAKETSIGQDIVVCQEDVRAVQLAKGAMYAGARLMMRRLGAEKLDKVILAGAFGSYIDKKSAAAIGLFPDCALENIIAVGNAAGDGARIALLNVDKRKQADEIARQVEYIELTLEKDFIKHFAHAMHFPHMEDTFPQLKGILPEQTSG